MNQTFVFTPCSMSLGGGKSTSLNNAVNNAVDAVSENMRYKHMYSHLAVYNNARIIS